MRFKAGDFNLMSRAWVLLLLGACAEMPTKSPPPTHHLPLVERLSWSADSASLTLLKDNGSERYLWRQLHPDTDAKLPAAVAARIAAMNISQHPLSVLLQQSQNQYRAIDALPEGAQRQAARQAYQQALNGYAREAASRSLLRDLYSQNGLQEQMAWFWLNHFSVYQDKDDLRVMVADYEDQLRSHALGRFRDLLGISAHHPAMLRYLDNAQNARGHINENYARELMELHTLGVDGGYSQHDVQELARILTGLGISRNQWMPKMRPALASQYVSAAGFEFNPERHDYGDKQFLGHTIHGQGLAEADQALDILARQPATARFISRKLARYFVGDTPSPALIARMSATYLATDGQISSVLNTLFHAPEFNASLGRRFKDPMHYVLSALAASSEGQTVLNTDAALNWLNRLGEPLYGHLTPDGYALASTAWASGGQIITRFEVARQIAAGNNAWFKAADGSLPAKLARPDLRLSTFYRYTPLAASTRDALAQAATRAEWNTFLLCAPEFMYD